MLALLLKLLPFILGLFGFGKKDERDLERQAGRDLGRAETGEKNALGEIHDIQAAKEARDAVAGGLASHPDELRKPDKFERP